MTTSVNTEALSSVGHLGVIPQPRSAVCICSDRETICVFLFNTETGGYSDEPIAEFPCSHFKLAEVEAQYIRNGYDVF